MRFAPHSLALCAGLGLLACSSSSATTTVIVRPQLISILPEDFLGSVRCSPDFGMGGDGGAPSESDASGELVAKSYVATLTDVTTTDDGGIVNFVLPSSPATPCTQPVTFSYLVTNHFYTARIEAYTENARQLAPFAPGSPLQLDESRTRVAAHWIAHCGGYAPSPGAGGNGGGGGAAVGAGGDAGQGTTTAGGPGVEVWDTVTQTPHDCGAGLAPIK
ncbi:MAG: hypothetical protein ABIQ16_05545 [Polyangiaceae bacterium]